MSRGTSRLTTEWGSHNNFNNRLSHRISLEHLWSNMKSLHGTSAYRDPDAEGAGIPLCTSAPRAPGAAAPSRLPDRALRRIPTSLREVFEIETTLDRVMGHGAPQLFARLAGSRVQDHVNAMDDSAAASRNLRVKSIVMAGATVSVTAAISRPWRRARR